MIKTIAGERRHLIIAVTALCLIGYIYLTPPTSQSSVLRELGIDTRLSAQSEMYYQRFALSFILLGVFPAMAARICGFKLGAMGLRKPVCRRLPFWLVAAVTGGALIGFIGSLSPALSHVYPYDPSLPEKVKSTTILPFLLHAVYYGVLYYLPWELLFRGVLIFPFLDEPDGAVSGKSYLIASFQVIPSSILHLGHPGSETVGAVFLGFIAGWIAVKTRSIIPALLFHAAAGIVLDLAIVLGQG
jgi:membrane protease YdiL (CAAX protease family)